MTGCIRGYDKLYNNMNRMIITINQSLLSILSLFITHKHAPVVHPITPHTQHPLVRSTGCPPPALIDVKSTPALGLGLALMLMLTALALVL